MTLEKKFPWHSHFTIQSFTLVLFQVYCAFFGFYLTITYDQKVHNLKYLILASNSVLSYRILGKLFSNKLMLAINIQSSKE